MAFDFNTKPYYDDFSEAKKFLKVLFRPGFAVQARELNQIQSILQNQISKFANHIFKEGSIVVGGKSSFDNNVDYIVLNPKVLRSGAAQDIIASEFTGNLALISTSANENAPLAKVVATEGFGTSQYPKIYIKYLNGERFSENDAIYSITYDGSGLKVASTNKIGDIVNDANTYTGKASTASITSGIVYTNGYFVICDEQTAVTKAYNSLGVAVDTPIPNCTVGLSFTDSPPVTANDDVSLLDNATGTPNYAAEGAHRYRINLTLSVKKNPEVATTLLTTDKQFIGIMRLEEGIIAAIADKPVYSEIEKTLARRTYDESGDYTVDPFIAEILADNNCSGTLTGNSPTNKFTTTNFGSGYNNTDSKFIFYTQNDGNVSKETVTTSHFSTTTKGALTLNDSTTISAGWLASTTTFTLSDPEYFFLKLDPGKAYVKGFEFETISPYTLSLPKARTTKTVTNQTINLNYGSYFLLDTSGSPNNIAFDFANNETVNLVNGSTTIGTAKIRGVEFSSSTLYKLYVFDLRMTGDIKDITKITSTLNPAGCLVKRESVTVFTSGGTTTSQTVTKLYENSISNLIFPTNKTNVKTLKNGANTEYNYSYKIILDITCNVAGTITLPILSTGTYSSTISDYVVIKKSDGTVATITTVTPATLSITGTFTNGVDYYVIGSVSITDQAINTLTKTFYSGSTTGYVSAANDVLYGPESLKYTDKFRSYPGQVVINTGKVNVKRIISVKRSYVVDGVTIIVDVTSNFTVYKNAKDDYYDVCYLVAKPGFSYTTSDTFVITLEYYDLTATGTGGFFTVDSYANEYYDDIPVHISPYSGQVYYLRDCIDFRPYRNLSTSSRIFDPSYSFISGFKLPEANIPFTGFRTENYLSRVDKLVLTKDKYFRVITGESSDTPIPPPDDPNGMTLYVINIPAYTYDPKDISLRYIEHKRYTMRDIGKLERRIDNLEYYTSLSLLERETENLTIKDTNGNDRFKNGFLVDNFSSHSVVDVLKSKYSIDTYANILKAPVVKHNAKLEYSSANSTVTNRLSTFTVPYTIESIIEQPYASKTEKILAFNTFRWIGSIALSPSSDFWFDTTKAPDVLLNSEGVNDHLVYGNQPYVHDSDDDLWEGRLDEQKDAVPYYGKRINPQTGLWEDWWGEPTKAYTAFINANKQKTKLPTVNQNNSSITQRINKVLVDASVIPYMRATSINFEATGLLPNTRVYPYFDDTDVKSYVTGVIEVTQTSGASVSISVAGGATIVSVSTSVISSYNLTTNDYIVINNIERKISSIGTNGLNTEFTVAAFDPTNTTTGNLFVRIPATNSKFKTNKNGYLKGTFNVPSSTFRTGNRNFKLTEKTSLDVKSDTFAQAVFSSSGILKTEQNQIYTIRPVTAQPPVNASIVNTTQSFERPEIGQDEIYSSFVPTQTKTPIQYLTGNHGFPIPIYDASELNNYEKSPWGDFYVLKTTQKSVENVCEDYYDPLAQTFLISKTDYPEGVFLNSVDIYFASKDSVVPVTLQIRPTVNGYPNASVTVPMTTIVKNPDQINLSDDASAATNFQFNDNVYLAPGEYAIVLIANSLEYEVHVSEVGMTNYSPINKGKLIDSQPYLGSFFKSQNAATWTAEQQDDLKFKINVCKFTTNTDYVGYFSNGTILDENTNQQITDSFDSIYVNGFRINSEMLKFNSTNTKWSYVINGSNGEAYGAAPTLNFIDVKEDIDVTLTSPVTIGIAKNVYFKITMNTSNPYVSPLIGTERNNVIFKQNLINSYGLTTSNVIFTDNTTTSADGTYTITVSNFSPTSITATVANGTSTSLTLSAAGDVQNYDVILVESEKMLVTSGAGTTTLTVVRGYEGTTAAAHTSATVSYPYSGTGANLKAKVVGGVVTKYKVLNEATNLNYMKDRPVTISSGDLSGTTFNIINTNILKNVGSSNMKYITRKVTLADGQLATTLKVLFAAVKPKDTEIDLYYKISNTDESTVPFDDNTWYRTYSFVQPSQSINTQTQFADYEYTFNIPSSNIFSIMLVFRSTNTSSTPFVKDLRVIAVA